MLAVNMNIEKIRKDFPALKRCVYGRSLAYLDSAATSLKPQSVIDAITRYYTDFSSNVHRGVHYLSEESTAAFEEARCKIQRFIGARQNYEIVFTRGTTESINLVAQSFGRHFLKEGDEILITHMEHHSNIVPWQFLCREKNLLLKVVPVSDSGEISVESFEKMLTPKTRLVALTYVSNALGTVNPVKNMVKLAHTKTIPVLIDGAQAVSQLPVDVSELDCDFFAFSGHKMFGPTGIGVLYAKADYLHLMPPVIGGGDMILSVTFEKTTYNSIPYKFEAGTPHIAGVIGLGAAVDYIQSIGFGAIVPYEKELLVYATKSLKNIKGLRIIGEAAHKVPIVSFVMDGVHPHDIGTIVDEEGVAIRTGHHCAQPLMKRFGVPATARAAMSFYNNQNDIDRLVEALDKVKRTFQ